MSQSTNEARNVRLQAISNVVSVVNKLSNEHLYHALKYFIYLSSSPEDSHLSKRETEVLTLIANGYSRKQVGESLGISANTAARHISTIYLKLDISTVAEATRYAIWHGIA